MSGAESPVSIGHGTEERTATSKFFFTPISAAILFAVSSVLFEHGFLNRSTVLIKDAWENTAEESDIITPENQTAKINFQTSAAKTVVAEIDVTLFSTGTVTTAGERSALKIKRKPMKRTHQRAFLAPAFQCSPSTARKNRRTNAAALVAAEQNRILKTTAFIFTPRQANGEARPHLLLKCFRRRSAL